MGLRKGNSSHLYHRSLADWRLPAAAVGIAGVLALFGNAGRSWLSFDRPALDAGEFWRLLTCHFVHLGVSHLLLNVLGLLLIWYLIASSLSQAHWLFVTLFVIVGIDLGLWFLEPQLVWYVGLSGLLHGLLAAGIVAGFRSGRIDVWILGVALVGKLAYEQMVGPLPGSEQSTGGAVIVASHLYGAVAGLVAAALVMIRVRRPASI